MKLKNYLLLLLISSTTAFGQSLTNQLVIGGNGDDDLQLFNLKDGSGYYLSGNSTSSMSGTKSENLKGQTDYWLVKTDNQFNILWDKSIGGANINWAWNSLPHDNGVYIIGTSNSNASGDKTMDSYGGDDIWLLNVTHEGHINWQAQYGGDMLENNPTIIEFTDTSLLVVCESGSGVSGNKTVATIGSLDVWLLEISKLDGRIIQQKAYGTESVDKFVSIAKNPSNNHFYMSVGTLEGISGDKSEYGYGAFDVWILELDENLSIVREKVFGGSLSEYHSGSLQFVGDYIYLPLRSQSEPSGNKTTPSYNELFASYDIWVLKLNLDLSIVWDKSYGGSADESFGKILALPNGNLVLMGSTSSNVSGNVTASSFGEDEFDAWMIVVTDDGDIVYQERFGGSLTEFGAIYQGNNNEYILCAYSNSGVSGVKTVPSFGGADTWIGIVDSQALLDISSALQINLSVFPNPVVNELTIQGNYQGKNYEIIDMNGKVMSSNQIFNSQSTIDVSFLQTGLYILQLEEKQFKFSKR